MRRAYFNLCCNCSFLCACINHLIGLDTLDFILFYLFINIYIYTLYMYSYKHMHTYIHTPTDLYTHIHTRTHSHTSIDTHLDTRSSCACTSACPVLSLGVTTQVSALSFVKTLPCCYLQQLEWLGSSELLICLYTHTHTPTHMHTYIYIYICMHTHTCTHT